MRNLHFITNVQAGSVEEDLAGIYRGILATANAVARDEQRELTAAG